MFRFALLLFVLCLTVVFSIQTAHAENVQIEGATTAALKLYVDGETPAAGDLVGLLRFLGNDDAEALTEYGRFGATLLDPTGGGEGGLFAQVRDGSVLRTILSVTSAGLTISGDVGVTGALSVGSVGSGYILPASRGTDGQALVAGAGGSTVWSTLPIPVDLGDLDNVSASSPGAGAVLKWTGSQWEPSVESPVEYLADLLDVTGSPQTDEVLAYNAMGEWAPKSLTALTESDTLATVASRGAETATTLTLRSGAYVGPVSDDYLLPIKRGPVGALMTQRADGLTTWAALSLSVDDLSDVVVGSPSAGHVLRWSGSQWESAAQSPGAMEDLINVDSGAGSGDVLVYNGSTWAPSAPGAVTLDDAASNGSATSVQITLSGGVYLDGDVQATDSTGVGLKDDAGHVGVWVEDGGQVGVGTASPANALDVNGGIDATTLNTGQGDYELYAMNQNVRSTDAVSFATVNTGNGAYEVNSISGYLGNQNLRTTDAPTFATINTGYGSFEVGQHLRTTDAATFSTINTGYGAKEVNSIAAYYGNQNLRTTDAPTFSTINTGNGAYEVRSGASRNINQDLETNDHVDFESVNYSNDWFAGVNTSGAYIIGTGSSFNQSNAKFWFDTSGHLFPVGHKTQDMGSEYVAWRNMNADNFYNRGPLDFSNVSALDYMRDHPPTPKPRGTRDDVKPEFEDAGEYSAELCPSCLPVELTDYHTLLMDYDHHTDPEWVAANVTLSSTDDSTGTTRGDSDMAARVAAYIADYQSRTPHPDERDPSDFGVAINQGFSWNYKAIHELAMENEALKARVAELELLVDAGSWRSSATVRLTSAAKREALVSDPWIEVDQADAVEQVQETETAWRPTVVTKHRINPLTGELEQVSEQAMERVEVPTNSWKYQLKAGHRLDEASGKFYRRRALEDVVLEPKVIAEINALATR